MLPLLLLLWMSKVMQKEEATTVDRTEAEVCAAVIMKDGRGKGRVAVPGLMIMRGGEALIPRIGMAG